MTNKAYFFRDVKNIQELENETNNAIINSARAQKYNILKNVELSSDEFKKFASNFIKTYDFVTPYRVHLDMNSNYEYVCLCVTTNDNPFDILVNTTGYSYARTVAIKKKS